MSKFYDELSDLAEKCKVNPDKYKDKLVEKLRNKCRQVVYIGNHEIDAQFVTNLVSKGLDLQEALNVDMKICLHSVSCLELADVSCIYENSLD